MPHNNFAADPFDVKYRFQVFAKVLSGQKVPFCFFNRFEAGLDVFNLN